ncbi:MAG: CRISPR-associated protein Cas4 [Candidatus Micrarchaeia archaeon]
MTLPTRVIDVVEHVFCPKFTYFQHVLGIPQHEEKRGSVLSGRQIHERRLRNNPAYVIAGVPSGARRNSILLYSERLDLIGRADYIILSGTEAVLVEQKYASPFIGATLKTQVSLLAILLSDALGLSCSRAIIRFLKPPKSNVELPITEEMKAAALKALADFRRVCRLGIMPFSRYTRRCEDCCYRKICPVGSLKTNQ